MPRDVVPIRRSPRRASRQDVELAVIRQDEMRAIADEQPAVHVDAQVRQFVHFGEQRLWIDDHAVADDTDHAVVQDARRNEMQDELLPLHIHRVTGVVSALITGHDRERGVSRSTILPLPSSPHCAPSTARFFALSKRSIVHRCARVGRNERRRARKARL